MVKLVSMYRTPNDTEAFDRHVESVHTPILKRLPGLRSLEVARITGSPIGEPQHYLMTEMYFDDEESLQRALASPDGKAAAMDVMEFAGTLVTVFSADVRDV